MLFGQNRMALQGKLFSQCPKGKSCESGKFYYRREEPDLQDTSERIIETEVLVLGGGLSGLSAAWALGNDAIVLERDNRPGGLVKTECFSGYWFDHVIHLLYFADTGTQERITSLLDGVLHPCPPIAWVECSAGRVRYPLQLHLGGLEQEAVIRCLKDFAQVTFSPSENAPMNFEEMLLQTFGRSLCETFFFPYNRKMWKRPLDSLAPSGFQWNIARPDFERVVQGILSSNTEALAYNAAGWYPRPPRNAELRGMEVLTQALAGQVCDLRLNHTVESIDLDRHLVTARYQGQTRLFYYHETCVTTLPLPQFVTKCLQAPPTLRRACTNLARNRVLSAAFCIRGPRPSGQGHWCYYAEETLLFTRLIFMHEFDPDSAPEEGWGLLIEITEPAETLPQPPKLVLERVRADLLRIGAVPDNCQIIEEHLLLIDPAYVVFTTENRSIVEQAHAFLADNAVLPVGRYGRWEYSSMAQVMRDGFTLGEQLAARLI